MPEFIDAFDAAHEEGWLCLMKSVLEMTCRGCSARFRSVQWHQVMRRKLADQPEWKRDIVVFAWAAMADIKDNDYLRETDMPIWLHALLGSEKTPRAGHVRPTLEHLQWTLERYQDRPNAAEAARLAGLALGR